MGKTSSKCCRYICCGSPTIKHDFPELQPMYPDLIDPITVVCVSFFPGGIPMDIGACIYGSRHTFTRVMAGGLAHRAGVREGDQLVNVNGVDVEKLRHEQVINMFAGIGDAVKMEMRRPSRGSNTSSQSMSDAEIITAQLKTEDFEVVTPVMNAYAHTSPVTLLYDKLERNQINPMAKSASKAGVLLPKGKLLVKVSSYLPNSERSDATIAVHSFSSIPPENGTYVVLEFEELKKFFTCPPRGRQEKVRLQSGSTVENITSPNDARVFVMSPNPGKTREYMFESTKFPGTFLTAHRGNLLLKSSGSTIESQHFKLHVMSMS